MQIAGYVPNMTDHSKLIRTGLTPQIFSAYSLIDRSDENLPMRATFRMDIFVQFF